jgi:hypothetical protein
MNFFCNNCDVIYAVLISGILSAIGQALRIGIGVYKLRLNKHPLVNAAEQSHPSSKLGGIFIGFIAGMLLTLATKTNFHDDTMLYIVILVATGYAITYGIELAASYFAKKQKSRHQHSNHKPTKQQLTATPLVQGQFAS